jgi:hypothetical protein
MLLGARRKKPNQLIIIIVMNRADFRRLMLLLRSLKTSVDDSKNSIRTDSNPAKYPSEPPPQVVVQPIVSLPPAVIAYYESEQRERPIKERRERIKRRVEYSGVLILGIYTAFTIGMYFANKKAADAAKSAADAASSALKTSQTQFQIDDRTYVWPGKIAFPPLIVPNGTPLDQAEGGPHPQRGASLFVNFYLRNTGRSPAKDAITDHHVVFGEKAMRGCFAFERADFGKKSGGSVIGIGGMIWVTASSVEDDINFPTPLVVWNGETPVLAYIVVQYRDIFNSIHHAKTCASVLPNGQFQYVQGQSLMDY